MGKFNKTTKGVVETPTTVNQMGEKAYVLGAKEELVSTVLTTFLHNSYYEKEAEIVKRINEATKKVDPYFVAQLALYARKDANMRSVTHLLAGELAERVAGVEWGSRFYNKIVQRPDDMSEILAYIKHKNSLKGIKLKIPNSIKKGFRKYLRGMDGYQIAKYQMKGKDLSLIDLLNLIRPEPTAKNAKAYHNLINGISLEGTYDSKILEKELTKAGQAVDGVAKTEEEVEELKGEAIKAVLSNTKGMPIMNLLRNLRNILNSAPDAIEEACKQLTIKEKILNSKLLPFRFATAYTEIESMLPSAPSTRARVSFEKATEQGTLTRATIEMVLKAIETALMYSVENIPELEGNTAVLVDHSGSVRGDGGGASKVSAFGVTTSAMIGNLFGSMMIYSQKNCYLGLFGDRLIAVPIDRKKGILEFNRNSFDEGARCGGSTENGLYIFLDECIKNGTKVDNLVIFSDMVIGSGGVGGWDNSSRAGLGAFQTLFAKFKALNPRCNTVCVNIRETSGKSVMHKSMRLTQVSGWSDKIFDIISNSAKGYDALIKEIESIKI